MSHVITGLFDTLSGAENVVDLLKQRGYGEKELSIIMRDREDAEEFAEQHGATTLSGVGAGAAIGGTIGAVLGGLLAVGTIAIPGLGLLATGAVGAMLAGAGAGGLAGSLVGWLVNLGIDDDIAPYYERTLTNGGIVVAVAAHENDDDAVRNILEGESVVVAGRGLPTYLESTYAERNNDLQRPASMINPDPIAQSGARNDYSADSVPDPLSATYPSPSADMRNHPTAENPRPSAQLDPVPFPENRPESTHPKAYDSVEYDAHSIMTRATDEMSDTVNGVNADERSQQRTADARERDAERESDDQNSLDHAGTAVANTLDNASTAVVNTTDRFVHR